MPERKGILIRLSLFQRVFAGCRQSLQGDGKLPRHDSLNLRKEVTLPINYEDTFSLCRNKPGSMHRVFFTMLWRAVSIG